MLPHLFKAPLGLPREPSPGSLHSCRVAVRALDSHAQSCQAFVASGAQVFQLELDLRETSGAAEQGKADMLLPQLLPCAPASAVAGMRHRAEIQSVVLVDMPGEGGARVASVDSCGNVIVAALDQDPSSTHAPKPLFKAAPPESSAEPGWCGLAFECSSSGPGLLAVPSFFGRCIDVYQEDRHLRTLRTLQEPSAVEFLPSPAHSSSLLLTTEGSQLSAWDVRAGERGGCVERIPVAFGGEPLYALCTDPGSGLVGVGGAERAAVVLDARKWAVRGRWTPCHKYEVTSLAFSSLDPAVMYVGGLDYEVACGRWEQAKTKGESSARLFGFRGDSRWLGLSKGSPAGGEVDLVAGWCSSGNLFGVRVSRSSEASPAPQMAA